MVSPLDYFVWLVGLPCQAYVVIRSLYKREFLRYFTLNFYLLAVLSHSVATFLVLRTYGLESMEYRYYYFYADALLTVFLYFTVLGFYQHVFEEMAVSKYISGGAVLLLGATASVSYMVVHQNADHMTERFVLQLSQNLYFVGLVLTYVLWGAVMQLKETRVRIIQLVLSLGIFFSGFAALYAITNMFPADLYPRLAQAYHWIVPVLGSLLPAAWAYTFTKFSEEARLATAQVAAHR